MTKYFLMASFLFMVATGCSYKQPSHMNYSKNGEYQSDGVVFMRVINGYSDVANLSIEDVPHIGNNNRASDFGIKLTFDESFVSEANIKSIYFETGSALLTPFAKSTLLNLIPMLKDKQISLNGFADPRASDKYNLELSRRRIETVADFLESHGVSVINRCAYGESRLPDRHVCGDKYE